MQKSSNNSSIVKVLCILYDPGKCLLPSPPSPLFLVVLRSRLSTKNTNNGFTTFLYYRIILLSLLSSPRIHILYISISFFSLLSHSRFHILNSDSSPSHLTSITNPTQTRLLGQVTYPVAAVQLPPPHATRDIHMQQYLSIATQEILMRRRRWGGGAAS